MKRLCFWMWATFFIFGLSYFASIYKGFTQREAVIVVALVAVAVAVVAVFSMESVIVTLSNFAAIGVVSLFTCDVPIIRTTALIASLLILAIILAVYYVIENDVRERLFFFSLGLHFGFMSLMLKYGYLLINP